MSCTALSLTAWAERWVADAFVFALLATMLVATAGSARHGIDPPGRSEPLPTD